MKYIFISGRLAIELGVKWSGMWIIHAEDMQEQGEESEDIRIELRRRSDRQRERFSVIIHT